MIWWEMELVCAECAVQDACEFVPLGLVSRVESAKHEDRNLPGYSLVCKDFRTISIFFLHTEALEALSAHFKQVLFPQKIR
jgi:hypothetical protein